MYLKTSEIDDELDNFNENSDWVQYWRNLYQKVTFNLLDALKAKYQKSEEERKDVLDAYKAWFRFCRSKAMPQKILNFFTFGTKIFRNSKEKWTK